MKKKDKEPRKDTCGFSVNDCPLWLMKKFAERAGFFNDCYWATLCDLVNKAEAYELLLQQGMCQVPVEEDVEPEEEPPQNVVETFGGKIPVESKEASALIEPLASGG